MSELAVATVGFAALLALILVALPIAVAMAIVGVGGTAGSSGWSTALATLRQGPFERATSYTLLVIPLFVFMGYVAAQAGHQPEPLSRRQRVARPPARRAGHGDGGGLRGVRRHLRLLGGHGRHHVLGGAARDAPLPVRRQPLDGLHRRRRHARHPDPAVIIFVIYGIMTEQSIGKLLMAGMIPGLVLTVLFIVAIALVTAVRPRLGAPAPAAELGRGLRATRGHLGSRRAVPIVIGGIYGGWPRRRSRRPSARWARSCSGSPGGD